MMTFSRLLECNDTLRCVPLWLYSRLKGHASTIGSALPTEHHQGLSCRVDDACPAVVHVLLQLILYQTRGATTRMPYLLHQGRYLGI